MLKNILKCVKKNFFSNFDKIFVYAMHTMHETIIYVQLYDKPIFIPHTENGKIENSYFKNDEIARAIKFYVSEHLKKIHP